MAVTIDATGTSQGDATATLQSFNYTGLTISSGLHNSYLVISIAFSTSNTQPTGVSVTWNSVAMTQIGTITNTNVATVYLFGLKNPTSGNQTAAISWTTVANLDVCGTSWSGVNQTTPFQNTATNTNTSTAASVVINSNTGDAVIAVMIGVRGITSVDHTQIYLDSPEVNTNSGSNRAAGASPSVTLGGVFTSTQWAIVGTDLVAAATITWGFEPLPFNPRVKVERAGGILKGDDGIEGIFNYYVGNRWEKRYDDIKHPKFNSPDTGDTGIQAKFINFHPDGWEIQPPPPPHTFVEKRGGILKGDEGIQQVFIRFFPDGWEIQPPPPPHTFVEKRGSILKGDDGTQFPFINFHPYGWEIQPVQPPSVLAGSLRNIRAGTLAQRDDGNVGKFINFFPYGWEIQPPQPPFQITKSRGTILKGIDGIESPYVNFHPYGWEIQPYQPPHTFIEKRGNILKGDDGTQAQFINFFPYGWEIQAVQPPFVITKSRGTILKGIDGIDAPFVPPAPTVIWGWEFQANHLLSKYHPAAKAVPNSGDDGTQAQFINFFPYGWEIQPPPPPHTFYEKRGSILRGIDGIESPYINFHPYGWEIQPPQPPHQFTEKRGSVLKGIDGIEAPYINFLPYGWEIQPPQPPFIITKSRGTILKGDEGTQAQFINFLPYGWEIQPYQPPHIFVEKRGSILKGIDGIEFPYINFLPYGWEIQVVQPPAYLKTGQKTGAWSQREDGIEAPFVFVSPNPVIWGFDGPFVFPRHLIRHLEPPGNIDAQFINFLPYGWEIQPYQPQHTFIRIPAILRGDDGTQAQFINFFPGGWEIQPPQPPTYPNTAVKLGALSKWEDGIEFPFVFNVALFANIGWENQAWQPPFKINRIEAFLRGDDGIEAQFVNFIPDGWEIQPPPPPHVFIERRGAILRGIDGIEAPFTVFFPAGWEIQPPPPPHIFIEKRGAILRGDDGTQSQFTRFFPGGWEVQPWQPPHPRPERNAAWMFGDTGTEGVYVFVPPPPKTLKPGWLVRARHTGRR